MTGHATKQRHLEVLVTNILNVDLIEPLDMFVGNKQVKYLYCIVLSHIHANTNIVKWPIGLNFNNYHTE